MMHAKKTLKCNEELFPIVNTNDGRFQNKKILSLGHKTV